MNKTIIFTVGVLCVISQVFFLPVTISCTIDATGVDDITKTEAFFTKREQYPAVLSEQTTIGFSARIVKSSGNQKIKTFERLLKNKFSTRENFSIELIVDTYMFFVKLSPQYISNLIELRRLNI